jgi:hypothetical protein
VTSVRGEPEELEGKEQVRRTFLEEGAVAIGKQWVRGCREDLRQQGRPAAGGWPGTLAEARARVSAHFTEELRRRSMVALTYSELDWVAKATYATAKRDWSSPSDPDEPRPRNRDE